MTKHVGKLLLTLVVTLLTTGLFAQKKYVSEGERPEIQKDAMRLVSWQGDDAVIFSISGTPSNPKPTVYTQVNAKTGKQTPFTGDIQSLYKSNDSGITKTSQVASIPREAVPSPDKQYVAFTRNNNLYTIRIADGKETQLTFDGSDVILNGVASYVYKEDVLVGSSSTTFWWSPDSKYIAFYRFDDSRVPIATITDAQPMAEARFINSGMDTRTEKEREYDYQHIYVETARYPQPGDDNPEVKVGLVSPGGGSVVWADFKDKGDHYLGTPIWRPDAKGLWVQWLNRGQDTLIIYNVHPATGGKEEVYKETQKTWVMIGHKNRIQFFPSGNEAIISSDKSGWVQLYRYDLNGKLINPITNGTFKVLDVLRIDEPTKTIYFTCYKDNVACIDLYKVGFDGKNLKRLTFGNYSHNVNISPNAKYFVTSYSNPSTPEKMALCTIDGKLVAELYDRKGADFDNYEICRAEIITVKSEDGKFDIPMRVTWPAGMEKGKKYPLSVRVYGGPDMMWMTHPEFSGILAKEDDDKVISVFMDHRGSGLCGKVGADYMHRNLGYWEIKDYSQCVKWLVENGQADPEKVYIAGHSYGGYLTCYALTYGADVFKFGMAGAPVTDWKFYNTAYTERYMDSPAENPEGYKNSSVITHADKLKGRLLIVHGMRDDNVHVQNTLQLANEFQRKNKLGFEMMLYPEDRHVMIGPRLTHLNNLRTRFQKSCFWGCTEQDK